MGETSQPVPVDQQLFAAIGNLFVNINNLQTFYLTTTDLLGAGTDHVEKKLLETGEEQLYKIGLERYRNTISELKNHGIFDLILKATAQRSVRLSKQITGSAALVFAHTILDGTLSDCCNISFEANPAAWHPFVEKRKVELGEAQNSGLNALLRQKTSEFVRQLTRESMAQRFEHLHKACVPLLGGEKPITHWIEPARLEAFDRVRQDVVHHQSFAKQVPEIEGQILFAALVGISCLALVGIAHGLRAEGVLDKKAQPDGSMLPKLFSGLAKDFPEMTELLKTSIKLGTPVS